MFLYQLLQYQHLSLIHIYVVDKDGKLVKDEFEEHLLSLDLEEFKKIPIRVGVAYGLDKKEAILGVLRGGYVNVLITDCLLYTSKISIRQIQW